MRIRIGEQGGYPPIVRYAPGLGLYACLGFRRGPRLRVAFGGRYNRMFRLSRS
jgi:hypothetical protein